MSRPHGLRSNSARCPAAAPSCAWPRPGRSSSWTSSASRSRLPHPRLRPLAGCGLRPWPADSPDAVFDALADPMRRRLLATLAQQPATATELASELPDHPSGGGQAPGLAERGRAPGPRAQRARCALPGHPRPALRRGVLDGGRRRPVGSAPDPAGRALAEARTAAAGASPAPAWPRAGLSERSRPPSPRLPAGQGAVGRSPGRARPSPRSSGRPARRPSRRRSSPAARRP